jgi:group I intron endonuclease
MFKGVVYKITNLINGKTYIGQTIQAPVMRYRRHCQPSCKTAVGNAIKLYGKENFKFEVLASAFDYSSLNDLEKMLIIANNSLAPNGYNIDFGYVTSPKSKVSIEKGAAKKRGMAYKNRRRGIVAANLETGTIIEVEVVKDFLNYGFTKANLSNIRWVLTGKTSRKIVKGFTFKYKNHANQNLIVENKNSTAVQRIGGETLETKNINAQETSTPSN